MSQAKPRGGSIIVRMILAIILGLIGVITLSALVSGNDPFQGRPLDNTRALIYLSVAFLSFAYLSFSIFRVRRGYTITGFTPIKVMSVVRCAQCSFKQIKNFTIGDYVFKAAGNCTQCGNPGLFINGIYADDTKKR